VSTIVKPRPPEAGRGEERPGPGRRLDPDGLGDHVDRLYRAAWAMCGNPHDAEDLVQETYAQVLSRPRFLRNEDDLGYLMRALRNTHVSRLRAAGRRPAQVPLDEERDLSPADARWQPERAFEAGELFATIANLPGAWSEAIVAVDVMGMRYDEAAKSLKVKEATLATRLHRARRAVVQQLTTTEAPADEPRRGRSWGARS
jgi:RNA polymerase sigma-70 factor (ECF subfamily)